jgi:hypothetical protein
MAVNPTNPHHAQMIVGAYLSVVEAHAAKEVYPCSIRELPYSKETIRAAFKTSTIALVSAGRLNSEMRQYLEVAYVSLADYVDEECVTLLREYGKAGEELAADPRLAREKAATDAWRRLTEQSRLAGQLARTISEDAERLRVEFRSWQDEVCAH